MGIFFLPHQPISHTSIERLYWGPSQPPEPEFEALLESQECEGQPHLHWENILKGRATLEKALLLDPADQNSVVDGIRSRLLPLEQVWANPGGVSQLLRYSGPMS